MSEKTGLGLDTAVSRREVIKQAMKVGGAVYVAPAVLMALQPASALAAVTGVPTATTMPPAQPTALPSACTRSLSLGLATRGTGLAGTTQTTAICPGTTGYRQTFQVSLQGAAPNTSFDVYIDQDSIGSAASHIYAGTFTTNGSGNAFFTASIIVPVRAGVVDNEIVLNDPTRSNYTQHQYFQDSFVPCDVAC